MGTTVGETYDLFDDTSGKWIGVLDRNGKEQVILTYAQQVAVVDLLAEDATEVGRSHFRWIYGDSGAGTAVTTSAAVPINSIDSADWRDATLHIIATGAGALTLTVGARNGGAGTSTVLVNSVAAGAYAVQLPSAGTLDFTATATTATMTVRAYVVAQSLRRGQTSVGVMKHGIGDAGGGISIVASGVHTSNPIDMQYIDRATATLRVTVTGTGTAKISAVGSYNGRHDTYSLGDLLTGMVASPGTYTYALSGLSTGWPFLTLTATETGAANSVTVTAYIEGTEPSEHVVTSARRKVAILGHSGTYATGTWSATYSSPWMLVYGMLTRMGYDVDVLAPSDSSTIFDGSARVYDFIVIPNAQSSSAWTTWSGGTGKPFGRALKGAAHAPIFVLGVSQNADAKMHAAVGANTVLDALGHRRLTISGATHYAASTIGYSVTEQAHMTQYAVLATGLASGNPTAWRFKGEDSWVYVNSGYMGDAHGHYLPLLLGMAINAGHIEAPPRKLKTCIDIDDMPDCGGVNGVTTVADLDRVYAAMQTMAMPCAFGVRPEDISAARQSAEVSSWVGTRTANYGGLLRPIAHSGSWFWKDGDKATKHAAYIADIAVITGAGIALGTDANQRNAWGYTYFNNNACDPETLELGSPNTNYRASTDDQTRQAGYGWRAVRLDGLGGNNTETFGKPHLVFGAGRQYGTTLLASATNIQSSEKSIAYDDDNTGTQKLGQQWSWLCRGAMAHGQVMYAHGSNCYDAHDGGNAPITVWLESLVALWSSLGQVVEFVHGADLAVD